MSLARHAKRRDLSEPAIIETLKAVGARVFQLDRPCDLLVRFRGALYLLDCDRSRKGKRDEEQLALFEEFGVIIVKEPAEALIVIGAAFR